MSRNYTMTVIVGSYDPGKVSAIREAANEEWSFEGWDETPPDAQRRQLMGWGDGTVDKPVMRIGSIDLAFPMPSGISVTDRAKLERAAGLCPIKPSFHPDIAVSVRYEYPE